MEEFIKLIEDIGFEIVTSSYQYKYGNYEIVINSDYKQWSLFKNGKIII